MKSVVYLYGFAPDGGILPPDGLLGVGDAAVELVSVADFQAVIGRVPADVYDADALQPRLDDLEWVAEQGLRHEQVVAWFVDHAHILPARLFTLYTSVSALEADARGRASRVGAELTRLAGCREWDLKISYSAERLGRRLADVSADAAALDAEIQRAAPGRRFLLEKKRTEFQRGAVAREARRLATEVLECAREWSEEEAVLDLPKEAEAFPVVLGAALLVRRDAEDALRQALGRRASELDGIGVKVDFSGPWAPYRFARGEQG